MPKRSRGCSCSQQDSCKLSSPSSAREDVELTQHTLQSSAAYEGDGVAAELLEDEEEDDEDDEDDDDAVVVTVTVVTEPSVVDPASSVLVVVVVVVLVDDEDDDPCAWITGALPIAMARTTASTVAMARSRGLRARICPFPSFLSCRR